MLLNNIIRNLPFCYIDVTALKLYDIMKKLSIDFQDYIPAEIVNLSELRNDIELKRQQYQHDTFASLLGIERASFTMKLTGDRKWKLSELIIIASRLGKNYQDYLKDSHADAAS